MESLASRTQPLELNAGVGKPFDSWTTMGPKIRLGADRWSR